jgi:hypothetical protein
MIHIWQQGGRAFVWALGGSKNFHWTSKVVWINVKKKANVGCQYLHPLRSASKYLTSQGTGRNMQFPDFAETPTGALKPKTRLH